MITAQQFILSLILVGLPTASSTALSDLAVAASQAPGHSKGNKQTTQPAAETALRYVNALAQGDRVTVSRLDFACQYRLATAHPAGHTHRVAADADPIACWQGLTAGHTAALRRTDTGLDVLWPSTGPFVFYGDDLPNTQASAFVMDALGMSPPGTGLRLTITNSRSIPNGSFRLKPGGPVIAVPTTLVEMKVQYQDPLTSPVTYGPGTVQWANTIKRERRAVKSILTQWVVFSGLRKHGFAGDTAVFHLPVETKPDAPGMVADRIPFTTLTSQALSDSIVWWGPTDQPGTLQAAATRAAALPDLRDRVALLNRILIIDPYQVEALTILTQDLYTILMMDASKGHKLTVNDPALALTVNHFYWNSYAASARLDLSNGMEMGGFSQPTPADFLYRLLPALEALAKTHPEQLDNRVRLGVAYRLNNDQIPMIDTFESLIKDIPPDHNATKTQALLQLAWSRINKVSWNRILHDPDSVRAYEDAKTASALAESPLDKFLTEYTMAYSMLFMPDYGEKKKMLTHLTEAKRWFDEVPGKDDEIWRYFLHSELLKAVLDADPMFRPILASAEKPKG